MDFKIHLNGNKSILSLAHGSDKIASIASQNNRITWRKGVKTFSKSGRK
jgi:hypothetical protein